MLLNVNMSGKPAVIIGGGKVAGRKAGALLSADAQVTVVSPDVTQEIMALAQAGRLVVRHSHYRPGDLKGAFLVVAATDDSEVNRHVAEDARSQGALVCVTDAPETGCCSFPALLRRGDLEIGVSTGGSCPSLAAEIRDIVASVITEEYEAVMNLLAEEREKLLTEANSSTYNTRFLRSLAGRLISELNERKDTA